MKPAAIAAALTIAMASQAWAIDLRSAGTIDVPPNAALMAVSTDPTIQSVLSEDIEAHRRNVGVASGPTVTLTVTLSQRVLGPGASLTDLAPGQASTVA